MIQHQSLLMFYLLPLLSSFFLLVFKLSEKKIRVLAFLTLFLPLLLSLYLLLQALNGLELPLHIHLLDIPFSHHHIHFNLYIDALSLVVLCLTGYLSLLVGHYSYYYLHREKGFQRFFRTIFLFVFGLHVIALAGSLDFFFAGWEIVGLSSFFLIAFYRDRTKPAKNAVRVFSIYRVCDLGLLVSAIIGHLVIKDADQFDVLLSSDLAMGQLPYSLHLTLGALLLFAALGKSAQFPFFAWPARAMEGPTPSSAIFYGALSLHCGAILLARTYPLWIGVELIKNLMIGFGAFSALIAWGIGSIQSNIKAKIAYSSVAHIGLMFCEIALGWHLLFLVHMTFNCLWRCFQLLLSPSSVLDSVKEKQQTIDTQLKILLLKIVPKRAIATLYTIGLQEGFFSPTERGGYFIPFIYIKLWTRRIFVGVRWLIIWLCLVFIGALIKPEQILALPFLFSSFSLLLSLKCLMMEEKPRTIWLTYGLSHLGFLASMWLSPGENEFVVYFFMCSSIPAWVVGFFSLKNMNEVNLNKFNGLYSVNPIASLGFTFAFIVLSGFPFTTIFWAEDMLLADQFFQAPLVFVMSSLTLMFSGLLSARLLVKVFWGYPDVVYH